MNWIQTGRTKFIRLDRVISIHFFDEHNMTMRSPENTIRFYFSLEDYEDMRFSSSQNMNKFLKKLKKVLDVHTLGNTSENSE